MVPNLWHIPDKESGTWNMLVARPNWLIDKILQHPGIVKKHWTKSCANKQINLCRSLVFAVLPPFFGSNEKWNDAEADLCQGDVVSSVPSWCGSNVWRSENMEQMRWNMADKTQVKHWWLWNMKKTHEHTLKSCQHFVSPMSFCLETRLIFFHLLLAFFMTCVRNQHWFAVHFPSWFVLEPFYPTQIGSVIFSYSKLGGSVEHS